MIVLFLFFIVSSCFLFDKYVAFNFHMFGYSVCFHMLLYLCLKFVSCLILNLETYFHIK